MLTLKAAFTQPPRNKKIVILYKIEAEQMKKKKNGCESVLCIWEAHTIALCF